MKMPRESYTIPERPADPPAMRLGTLPPMPPGYQGTKPFLSDEERPAPHFHIHPLNATPLDWWRDNRGPILAALPKADPAYRSRRPGYDSHPWITACLTVAGIAVVSVILSVVFR